VALKTIGLCMIVKNEASIIRKCLDSVRPLVDYVLIEDTGSDDGTPDVILAWLKDNSMPGEVIHEPWQNFAYNRSHALAAMRERPVDYAMIIDADDEVVYKDGFDASAFKSGLKSDVCYVEIRHMKIRYPMPYISSNKIEFRYKGVLHEYLDRANSHTSSSADGFFIDHNANHGDRSKSPSKYADDAVVLERALGSETDAFLRSRYTFYLAQSYRDCGEIDKAIRHYLERSEQGFWDEEVYISLCNVGLLMEKKAEDYQAIMDVYNRASVVVPRRAEALYSAARLSMQHGAHRIAVILAEKGLSIPLPASGLFLEPWVYEYGLLDVMAVSSFWTGEYKTSLSCALKALAAPGVTDGSRIRIAKNAQMAYSAILGS
jgi:glycosyltransferase involved in cell wall biosynthesis